MKYELYYNEHKDCQVCKANTDRAFKYIETKAGESYSFNTMNTYTIVFILSGEAILSCNNFKDITFKTGEVALWPANSLCNWKSITETSAIVLAGDQELSPCDSMALKEYADAWLNAIPNFEGLVIKPRLMEFLSSVKSYLDDGITCPYMHKAKQRELSMLFRAYYSPEELATFFFTNVQYTHEFEYFVMNNYLKMKGVKEFVDLSGMKLSTFNRKFKSHFKESPYQWLMKQKAKHIYQAIASSDKSFSTIAKEFHFTDASHFNRYCKAMFGSAPSKIREGKVDRTGM